MPLPPRLKIFPDRRQLAAALAVQVAEAGAASFQARGRFRVALSGGSLMDILAPVLSAAPLQERIDWRAWHVFWTDERCVPPGSPDSNSGAARRLLLGRVGIPGGQIHAVEDRGSPDDSARAYEAVMRGILRVQPGAFPRFDLILLGLGEDGHTASLFPGHPALRESRRWVVPVVNAPKPPPVRVTMTLPVLNHARHVVFVAAGSGKAGVVAAVFRPGSRPPGLPAQMIRPVEGELHGFIDRAAAAGLRMHPPLPGETFRAGREGGGLR